MGNWDIISNKYKINNFIGIPEGCHRAEITKVKTKKYSTNKKRFIITLKVAHYRGKIWYDLWYDFENKYKDARKWTHFFTSFEINDTDISNYKEWVGKKGAIRVRTGFEGPDPSIRYEDLTEEQENNLYYTQKVVSCVFGEEKDKLPPWDKTFISTCFER